MVFTQQVFYSYVDFFLFFFYHRTDLVPIQPLLPTHLWSIPVQIEIVLYDFYWEVSNKLLKTCQNIL